MMISIIIIDMMRIYHHGLAMFLFKHYDDPPDWFIYIYIYDSYIHIHYCP